VATSHLCHVTPVTSGHVTATPTTSLAAVWRCSTWRWWRGVVSRRVVCLSVRRRWSHWSLWRHSWASPPPTPFNAYTLADNYYYSTTTTTTTTTTKTADRQTGRQTDISRRKTLTLFHIFDIHVLHTEKTGSRPQRSLMVVDATENWLIMIRQSINQYSFITAWQNAGQHDGAFWPDLITVIGVKCLKVFYLPQQDWY